jgi:hypothetical protein
MSRMAWLIAALMFIVITTSSAQVRFRVATGLSTDWITNDNPATYRLTGTGDPADTTSGYGGGFDGVQIGWGIKAFADLDKQKIVRIPFGVDLFNYSGAQSVQSNTYKVTVRHDMNLWSPYAGIEWSFVEFPLAYARAYVGAEARVTHVAPNSLRISEWYSTGVTTDTTFSSKEAATRLGGMIRLGIEGEIYYPVFVNTSVSWGVMNLIGRDDRPTGPGPGQGGRGELLTAAKVNEAGESLIYHLNFTFMIQIRI